jgi:hypothetical protein
MIRGMIMSSSIDVASSAGGGTSPSTLWADHLMPLVRRRASILRSSGVNLFMAEYLAATEQDRNAIDQSIRNQYMADLSRDNWSIQQTRTHTYLVRKRDSDELTRRISQLMSHEGFSFLEASGTVHKVWGMPVNNAQAYRDYMLLGNSGSDERYVVSLVYNKEGLVCVNDDTEGVRVSWGDDRLLECCANHLERKVFVALIDRTAASVPPRSPDQHSTPIDMICGELVSSERRNNNKSETEVAPLGGRPVFLSHGPGKEVRTKGLEPWFLLMLVNGSEGRGGDHYEPLCSSRIRGSETGTDDRPLDVL